ncbi:uracil-DNA glycosylase-like [Mercenaria mercenaria]|uniref:uracil-DNA glycosylase-like n=1 Tax=Mercenaria mercenaria TaxID=6596 RepID=UPI00234EBAB8|nr:uracil-DNA glycosylase-like [Mercenaria mercenaria]
MCAAMSSTTPCKPTLKSFFPQYWEWPLNDVESKKLEDFFWQEYECQDNVILPELKQIFAAFHLTPLASVKVVILGQDPYCTPYSVPDTSGNTICIPKATGLAFSVPPTILIDKIPRSLRNIFKEVANNGFSHPSSGCLEGWARQGVLLLNSALTVRQGVQNSHAQAWKTYTDNIIKMVSATNSHVVFMLWGNFAKKKGPLIEQANSRHTILVAGHPSPLSERYFTGCRHFAQCNIALSLHGQDPINWSV